MQVIFVKTFNKQVQSKQTCLVEKNLRQMKRLDEARGDDPLKRLLILPLSFLPDSLNSALFSFSKRQRHQFDGKIPLINTNYRISTSVFIFSERCANILVSGN